MGQSIVFVSGKGGVGKTTVVANLGMTLARMNKKVIMIDTDIGLRKLDLSLGMENSIVYDYLDVLDGTCRMRQAIIKTKLDKNLFLMSPSQTRREVNVTNKDMELLISKLKSEYDYVLIDSPSGIDTGFFKAIAGADKAVIVAIPDLSSIRDAENVINILRKERYNSNEVKLIVNQIRPSLIKSGVLPSVDDIYRRLRAEMIGLLPYDEKFIVSSNTGEPAVTDEDSFIKEEFEKIANRVLANTSFRLENDI